MSDGGSWDTEYGRFFLSWYSRALLKHADCILSAAHEVLDRQGMPRECKAEEQVCCLGYADNLSDSQCLAGPSVLHRELCKVSAVLIFEDFSHCCEAYVFASSGYSQLLSKPPDRCKSLGIATLLISCSWKLGKWYTSLSRLAPLE